MDNPVFNVKQVALIGTGLIGTSCGLGLRASGYGGKIIGVGRRLKTAERARALGGIDEATIDLGSAVGEAGLVVLATPLGAYEALFGELAKYDHEGLVITDVGSAKQCVGSQANRLLPDPTRFVGSHPMAGSEKQGPDAARAELFHGKPCIVTAQCDTDPRALATVEAFWAVFKMRLIRMSASEHDQRVAGISHLPHALAVLLLILADEDQGLELASTGFRDATRLAGGDPGVWRDIFAGNRASVIRSVEQFRERLDRFHEVLVGSEDDRLFELLREARGIREGWIDHLESKDGSEG